MRGSIDFLLNGEPVSLSDVDPRTTLLDWLREEKNLTGTKEGCNEGDCGACTVGLTRLTPDGPRREAVNACIQLLPMLDGRAVTTVEALAGPDRLHPVQEAMVDLHGSQCGFCTPGFVMSLFAMTRDHAEVPDEATIDDVLAGNLCRCTGYAPIVRAARKMYDGQAYEKHPRDDAFADQAAATLGRLDEMQDAETVAVEDDEGGRRFFAPATLDQLAVLYADHPEATLAAGATDVGLWVTKQLKRPQTVIYSGRVGELQQIEETADAIEIGAGVTYSDAMDRLAQHYPDMGEVIRRIGSMQIRNTGTLGGNIANGSPIGDSPPLIIAAGATLHLRHGTTQRSMPSEDFLPD